MEKLTTNLMKALVLSFIAISSFAQSSFQIDSAKAMDLFYEFELCYFNAEYDKVKIKAQEALQQFSQIEDSRKDSLLLACEANLYFGVGFEYFRSDLDSAQFYLNKSLDIALSSFGEKHLIVTKCYNKLGNIAKYKSDYRTYAELVLKSLRIREEILDDYDLYMMLGYYNAFVFYHETGDFEQSFIYKKKYYEVAKYFYDNYKKYLEGGEVDMQLWNRMHTNHMPKAIQTRFLYSYMDTYLIATSRMYSHHDLRNELEHKEHYIMELKKISELFDDNSYFKSTYLLDLYDHLLDLNQFDSAQIILNELRSLLNDFGDDKLYLDVASLMARGFAESDPRYCLELIQRNNLYQESEKIEFQFHYFILSISAKAYFHLNQLDSAMYFVNECWKIIEKKIGAYSENKIYFQNLANLRLNNFHQLISLEAFIYANKFLESKDGDFLQKELVCYQKYDRVLNELFLLFRKESSFYHSTKNSHEIYEKAIENSLKLYELTKDEFHLERIFYWANQSKSITSKYGVQARTFYKNKKPGKTRLGDLSLLELAINRSLFEEKQKTVLDSLAIQNLEKNLYQTQRELEITKDSLMGKQMTTPFSYKNLATDIQEKKVDYIEYFVGQHSLYGIGVFQDTTMVIKISLDRCHQLSQRFIESNTTEPENWENYSEYNSTANELYNILLGPYRKEMSRNDLLIIPDGFLNYLPFHLLTTGEKSVKNSYRKLDYLQKYYNVLYEYNSSNLIDARDQKFEPFDNNYLGIAPSYQHELFKSESLDSIVLNRDYSREASEGFTPLIFNQSEISETSEILSGITFQKTSATETNFKRQNIHSNQIIHFAGHGLVNNDHPQYSQLAMLPSEEEDGSLYAYEIEHLNLNSELVVLSACNTGYGNIIKGEGIMSLARSFKLSGCPNIVMSLWLANDFSTKVIVTDFFKNLKGGLGKATALRNAQLDFLANVEDEKYTHPYYWANLMVIGDNEVMELGGKKNKAWILLAGLTFVAVLGIGLFQRYKAAA